MHLCSVERTPSLYSFRNSDFLFSIALPILMKIQKLFRLDINQRQIFYQSKSHRLYRRWLSSYSNGMFATEPEKDSFRYFVQSEKDYARRSQNKIKLPQNTLKNSKRRLLQYVCFSSVEIYSLKNERKPRCLVVSFGADSGICKELSDGAAITRRRHDRVTSFRQSRYREKTGTPSFSVSLKWS